MDYHKYSFDVNSVGMSLSTPQRESAASNAEDTRKNTTLTPSAVDKSKNGQVTGLTSPMLEKVEAMKATALAVKEYAVLTRETIKAIRESGTIPEIVLAVREIAAIVSTVSKDVRTASIELRQDGTINEVSGSADEAVQTAREIVNTVKGIRGSGHQAAWESEKKTASRKSGEKYQA